MTEENKLEIYFVIIVWALLTCLFTGLITLKYYEENIEKTPCFIMKLDELHGYSANHSDVWNKRVECGLVDVNLDKQVQEGNNGRE